MIARLGSLSLRARLTLWYSLALLAVLALFGALVVWQQGRIAISRGTSGIDVPAALLGRHDRQVLKNGFRIILQLIELTAGWSWLDGVNGRSEPGEPQ